MEHKGNKGSAVIFIYIIVAIIVVVGIVVWWRQQHATSQPAAMQSNGVIHNLPDSEIPPAMPQGIVVASDAQIVHSYIGTTSAGKNQAALVYTTSQSLSDLLSEYFKYFVSNGWSLQGSHGVATSTGKTTGTLVSVDLLAAKASTTISVLISENGTLTRIAAINLSTR